MTAQSSLDLAPDSDRTDTIPGEARPADTSHQARRKELLTTIVEAEILPRLARIRQNLAVMGHSASTDAAGSGTPANTENPTVDTQTAMTEADTVELVRLLLTEEASGAIAFIDVLRLRGATPASICLGVVTDAAHRLGELWDEDLCDFAQVTISMGRLQQVLRALSPHFQLGSVRRAQPDSLLLAPAPGEQHTFGLIMLGEFFRREGWHVAGGPVTSPTEAAEIVRATWIDVAGFSIGSTARLEGLAQCIRAVRRSSRNPNLYVMVGGPLILTHPDLVIRLGADTAATDAAGAVRQANGLLAMRMAAD